jgi:signal recognition particle subunit SRP54
VLETVTQGFQSATERLRGVRALDADNIAEALRDVRASLLEADVDFEVVKDFLGRVKQRALGEKVETRAKDAQGRPVKVTPGQHFVAICEQELTDLMGPVDPKLARARGATSVMLVGLQGVGKTTVAAKLARKLQSQGKRPLLVAADVYRPAAIDQLEVLGASIDVAVHRGAEGESPPEICRAAAERARREGFDAIVYDTAGRLAIDDELMGELDEIAAGVEPANTLLVCDALMGRDAVNVAAAFKQRLDLDGIVMTKLDGDARGGAALAVKAVTGVPIKFLGTGESVDRLEEFRPEGLASRILGMGDIVGLVQDFEAVVDEKQAEEDAERILQGQFTLDDLLTQLKTIQKLGPIREVFARMPMFNQMADQVEEGQLRVVESMIQSMTRQERGNPDVIDKSRVARIARGSGRKQKEVSDLVKRFHQMKDMMSQLGGADGLLSRIPGMDKLAPAGAGGMDPSAFLSAPGPKPPMQKKNASTTRKKKRKQQRAARRKGRRR